MSVRGDHLKKSLFVILMGGNDQNTTKFRRALSPINKTGNDHGSIMMFARPTTLLC